MEVFSECNPNCPDAAEKARDQQNDQIAMPVFLQSADEESDDEEEIDSPYIHGRDAIDHRNNPNRRPTERDAYLFKNDHLIPPPEPLLPKNFAPKEPLRTGAQTPFLKLKAFISRKGELAAKQLEDVDSSKRKQDNPLLNELSLRSLFAAEFRGDGSSPVVYNRYQPMIGSTAYQNSAYQILKNEFNPMIQLVNVKELIANDQTIAGSSSAPIVLPYYTPNDQYDKTLVFESRFESGNLAMALKLSDSEYNLVLQNDINTKGHTQWFFFRVTNTRKDLSVKFNLLNHTKPDSLFNYGMKVLVFSEQLNKEEGLGWHRDGRDISYYQNSFKKDTVGRSRYFYTMSFTYDFKHDEDHVFFAYSPPYTYTDLNEELTSYEKDPIKGHYLSRNTLCRSIAGNKCEYLTITSKNLPDQKQERKGVFLSARVHPGETNSSWMMKGIIDFLLSGTPEAFVLREKFVFKIVPMLNPDGVINGNYRCSLSGADLNRRWKSTSKLLFPEIFETKRLVKAFQRERQIMLYCDLHGHSRNKNVFIYGNNYPENPESTRLFPFIMSKMCDSFSYNASRFSLHNSKETTARVTMWRELKIPAVYTMEASFCGPNIGAAAGLHFTCEHLMDIGRRLCLALLIYCDVDVPKSLREIVQTQSNIKKSAKKGPKPIVKEVPQIFPSEQEITEELRIYTKKALIAELMSDKGLLNAGSTKNDSGDEAGSDSDPSEDNMEEEEIAKIIPIKVSKKKSDQSKKQQPIKKQFKQEENKETKSLQTTSPKKPIKKPSYTGGSFFDRVKLPKSFGLRRVEMIDAWTQTSNRSNSSPPPGSNIAIPDFDHCRDQGIQAQQSHKDHSPSLVSNIDVSPTRVKHSQPDKPLIFHLEQVRSGSTDTPEHSASTLNLVSNRSRPLAQSNGKHKSMMNNSLSPLKNDTERIQAMQIINQYIKETQQVVPAQKLEGGWSPLPIKHDKLLSEKETDQKYFYGDSSPEKQMPQLQFSFKQEVLTKQSVQQYPLIQQSNDTSMNQTQNMMMREISESPAKIIGSQFQIRQNQMLKASSPLKLALCSTKPESALNGDQTELSRSISGNSYISGKKGSLLNNTGAVPSNIGSRAAANSIDYYLKAGSNGIQQSLVSNLQGPQNNFYTATSTVQNRVNPGQLYKGNIVSGNSRASTVFPQLSNQASEMQKQGGGVIRKGSTNHGQYQKSQSFCDPKLDIQAQNIALNNSNYQSMALVSGNKATDKNFANDSSMMLYSSVTNGQGSPIPHDHPIVNKNQQQFTFKRSQQQSKLGGPRTSNLGQNSIAGVQGQLPTSSSFIQKLSQDGKYGNATSSAFNHKGSADTSFIGLAASPEKRQNLSNIPLGSIAANYLSGGDHTPQGLKNAYLRANASQLEDHSVYMHQDSLGGGGAMIGSGAMLGGGFSHKLRQTESSSKKSTVRQRKQSNDALARATPGVTLGRSSQMIPSSISSNVIFTLTSGSAVLAPNGLNSKIAQPGSIRGASNKSKYQ